MPKREVQMQCYCGSKRAFSDCCEPVINKQSACSAEQLMRSRFSAYACARYDYILATYTPEKRQLLSIKELAKSAENTEWLNLEVLSSESKDLLASVEFIARYRLDGEFWQMHELSHFQYIDGHWFYSEGNEGKYSGKLSPERNALCPCGSQKKYKKCCLK
jgi:SEC-C motif-containing protein